MKQGLSDAGVRRLQRLNALLAEGLALSEAERAAWLARIETTDPEIIDRLRALLVRSQVETDDFLREGVEGVLPPDSDETGDQPGDEVGPYRLLSRIGQGGMAAVWLAERCDEQLHRQVALKLPINAWGAGPGLARRMARERNILAAMEHPRIARLYEAGVTAAGRPWLAMERVVGQPLDQWCREHDPDVPELLRLFLQIADAVSHAHAHLVVHRDLKPANVLVDAQGDVHLLDFGVAKLLDEPTEGVDPQLTRQMGRAVTPDYAAPEQMGLRPLTMACDVYSLGIMLYEMLAGERPYRLQFESYGELEALALAAPVPMASTTAQRRDPDRAKALRGDLDTILAKALQKDPRDRYASVQSFADDVRRHLDGQPVLARTPSLGYLTTKLLRRHRTAVLTTAAIFIALGAGLAVALWQWQAASRERDYAEQMLVRTRAAEEFTTTVLTESIEVGERVSLAELLQRSKSLVELETAPVARAAAASTLARWYISYGNYQEAEAVLAQAVPQLTARQEPELLQFMQCQQGHVWSELGRSADAVKRLEEVARNPDTWPAAASYCLRILAGRARSGNDGQAAIDYANEALERLDASRGAQRLERALILSEQAYAEALLGRPDIADTHFAQAFDQLRQQGHGESVLALKLLQAWSVAWGNSGRPLKAWPLLVQASDIARRRSPNGELPVFLVNSRALTLRALGRWEASLQELAPMRRAVEKGEASPREAMSIWLNHFYIYAMQDRQAEALQAHDAAMRAAANLKFSAVSPGGWSLAYSQAKRSLMLGRPAEAHRAMDDWLQAVGKEGVKSGNEARALLTRAQAFRLQGRLEDAMADLREALKKDADRNQGTLPLTFLAGQAWLELGEIHQQSGRSVQARQAFEQARRNLDDSVGPEHPQAIAAASFLAQVR